MASPFLMSSPRSSFFLSSLEADGEAGEAAAERGGEWEWCEWVWEGEETAEGVDVEAVEAPPLRASLEEQRRGAASSARRRYTPRMAVQIWAKQIGECGRSLNRKLFHKVHAML